MHPSLDWDDLRFLLAISEAGSITRAARRLGVDQATVSRRLRGCETTVGAPLMERLPRSVRWTAAGRCAVEAAELMGQAEAQLRRRLASGSHEIDGTLLVTATEAVANHVIIPNLSVLRARHPALSCTVLVSNDRLSLSNQEADIALRLERPMERAVAGRKLGQLGFALYAAKQYFGRGRSRKPIDFRQCTFIGYESSLARGSEVTGWVDALAPDRILLRFNTTSTVAAAISAGLGIGALPRVVGDADPRLCAVSDEIRWRPIWLIVHQDLRSSPRIRAGMDFLVAVFEGAAAQL